MRATRIRQHYTSALHTESLVCYIAGPMRGYPHFNFPAFEEAELTLAEAGWVVFSPHRNDLEAGEAPDPEGRHEKAKPLKHYMVNDLAQVCQSDAVFFLDGWENSEGARLEWNVANALDIPCWSFSLGVQHEIVGRGEDGSIHISLYDPIEDEQGASPDLNFPEADDLKRMYDEFHEAVEKRIAATTERMCTDAEGCETCPSPSVCRRLRQDYHEDSKATNPKDLVGSGKLPIHLWPTTATELGSLGLLDGMLKYGRQNWRAAGIRYSIYHDAINRHLSAVWEGEWEDPDSGLPHWAHILACAAIVTDAYATGNLVDDRAYAGQMHRGWVRELTPHVERLKTKYADRNPKHWTKEDDR